MGKNITNNNGFELNQIRADTGTIISSVEDYKKFSDENKDSSITMKIENENLKWIGIKLKEHQFEEFDYMTRIEKKDKNGVVIGMMILLENTYKRKQNQNILINDESHCVNNNLEWKELKGESNSLIFGKNKLPHNIKEKAAVVNKEEKRENEWDVADEIIKKLNLYLVQNAFVYFDTESNKFETIRNTAVFDKEIHKLKMLRTRTIKQANDLIEIVKRWLGIMDEKVIKHSNIKVYEKHFLNGTFNFKEKKFIKSEDDNNTFKPFMINMNYTDWEKEASYKKWEDVDGSNEEEIKKFHTKEAVNKLLRLISGGIHSLKGKKYMTKDELKEESDRYECLMDILVLATTPLQAKRLILFYGVGDNYKTTLADLVKSAIGSEYFGVIKFRNLIDKPEEANLHVINKMASWDNDMDKNLNINISAVKELAEPQQELSCRYLYSDAIQFVNYSTPIANCNTIPKGMDENGANNRVIIYKIYTQRAEEDADEFKLTSKDFGLIKTPYAAEYLNWLICQHACKDGKIEFLSGGHNAVFIMKKYEFLARAFEAYANKASLVNEWFNKVFKKHFIEQVINNKEWEADSYWFNKAKLFDNMRIFINQIQETSNQNQKKNFSNTLELLIGNLPLKRKVVCESRINSYGEDCLVMEFRIGENKKPEDRVHKQCNLKTEATESKFYKVDWTCETEFVVSTEVVEEGNDYIQKEFGRSEAVMEIKNFTLDNSDEDYENHSSYSSEKDFMEGDDNE